VSIVAVTTRDADEQASALPGWSQTYAQVTPGRFAGRLELALAGTGSVFRETINVAHIERLVIPAGTVALALVRSPAGMHVDGRHLAGGGLMVTPAGAAHELTGGPGHELMAISVDASALPEGERPDPRHGHRPVPDGRHAARAAAIVEAMLAHAVAGPLPASAGATLADVVIAALAALEPARPESPASLERLALVRAYVHENLEEPLSVADLARVAGVSTRALEAAFARHLGVGPKAYLQSLRLAAARRALKQGATGDAPATVTDIAYRYGFWHLSRFAEHYRTMYGECPHQTLRGGRPH
jgi:AraC family ethanolamine operon transcriptional activator